MQIVIIMACERLIRIEEGKESGVTETLGSFGKFSLQKCLRADVSPKYFNGFINVFYMIQ